MKPHTDPRKWQGASSSGMKVGHYGCSAQLVKVSCVVPKGKRGPADARVDCPACGENHPVRNFMWRKPHSADEFELAEIKLGEVDA